MPQCVFNGSERLAAISVSPVPIPPPKPLEEGEEPPEGETEESRKSAALDAAAELINGELGKALTGLHTAKTLEVDDKISLIEGSPKYVVSMAIAQAAASMAGMPLHAFIASYNKEMVETAHGNIGGGVAVKVGDEEKDKVGMDGTVIDKVKSANTESAEADKPTGPKPGTTVRLPAPIFPGLAAGPAVEGAAVKMRGFWLVGKRDLQYEKSLPQLIKVHQKMGAMLAEKYPGEGAEVPREDGAYNCKQMASVDEVMGFIEEAVSGCELSLGEDVKVLVDLGATSFFVKNTGEVGTYVYKPDEDSAVEADAWPEWVDGFLSKFPSVTAINDAVAKDDYETWRKLRQLIGGGSGGGEKGVCLFGDDLFNDDLDTIRAGVAEGWAAGAMLRPEVLGTLTNVTDAVCLFTALQPEASRVILHHRAGLEAGGADADLAVGLGAWGIMCGSPGPLMTGKINRLIKVQEELQEAAAAGLCEVVTWEDTYAREKEAMQQIADLAQTAAAGP